MTQTHRRHAQLVVMLLAIAGTVLAAQSPPRVRHLDRFPTDLSENSGSWILKPDSLRALPSTHECAADVESPRCGLVKVGALGGSSWYWFWERRQERAYSDGQLIEVAANGRVDLTWGLSFFGEVRIDEAKLIEPAGGPLLLIPVTIPGTGAFREDFLFAWRGTHWQEVDTQSWRKAITLPPCYGIWKGPWIDFEALAFESQVWIEGDGNCCGTGGTLSVAFEIVNDVLRVAKWTHAHGSGAPSDPWRRIDPGKCKPQP